MSYPYYVEQLEYITNVTKILNSMKSTDGVYIHVELREEGSHSKIGEWSDEIASDCWSYTETWGKKDE